MRRIEVLPTAQVLKPKPDMLVALTQWIGREAEDALSSRFPQETVWRDELRQYAQVPLQPVRNVPVENAPNYEVPLGAIETDKMYAQIIDLIFNIQPVLTVRPVAADEDLVKERRELADILQEHVNWGVTNEWGLRTAANETLLDDVKLGTGIFFIPFTESVKKTASLTVRERGPRIETVPVEDFIVPGGSYGNLQETRWVARRWWLDLTGLMDRAREEEWDIEGVQSAGAISWVRNRRELLGRSWTNHLYPELYEIWKFYCYFDIDGDNIDEDLCVVWDRTSRQILKVSYNTYDRRPFAAARYQIRGHLFYGIGVMGMCSTFEQEASDIHSYAVANGLLANARFWKSKDGSMPEVMKVWPGKVQTMNDPDDLQAVAMADIYPSMIMMQQFPLMLAEKRIGSNDIVAPNRGGSLASSRTPGITAISLLSQANKRFTPAFDEARLATAEAVRQCLFREQERLLAGDADLEIHLMDVHGADKGIKLVKLLKNKDFDLNYVVELTASSSTLNRDVERQNAILLINMLGQYYQRVLELVAIASNTQTPEPVRDAARKIADAAGEIVRRTLMTFDQVRDPSNFIVDINEELDKAADVGQQGMQMLQQFLVGLTQGQRGQNGAGAQPGGVSVG